MSSTIFLQQLLTKLNLSLAAAKLRHSHPHCAAAAYLNVGVFAVHHSDYFPPQFCFVQMIDCQRRLLRFRHLN